MATQRVTDEQARECLVACPIDTILMHDLAADLLDERAEIATLRAKLAAVDLRSLIKDRAQMDVAGGAYFDAASLREILAAVGEGKK